MLSINRVLKKANRAFFNTASIHAISQKTEGFRGIAKQAVEKHRVFQRPAWDAPPGARGFFVDLWERLIGGIGSLVKLQGRYHTLLGGDFEEYRSSREANNFTRAAWSSLVLLIINVSGLLVSSSSIWRSNLHGDYQARIRLLYAANACIAAIAVGVALGIGLRPRGGSGRRGIFCRAVVIWIYALGAAFSLNGQGFHNQILNLFFSLLFVAAIFSLPPLFSLASHAALCAAFCALLGRFQADPFLLNTNAENAITAALCAFALSRVAFGAELDRFIQEKTIARKDLELRRQTRIARLLTLANERKLTPRETELVKLLLSGKSNKEVAAATSVEVDTVKKHLSSVFRKCGVGSRVELLLFFENDGVEDPEPG
jgi:DNA-binding CsgD family transcriptional regulator